MDKSSVADEMGCSDVTVHNWMKELGVPTARAWERESLLRHLYVEREMKQHEIAELLDCDQTTISRSLSKHGIKTRDAEDYLQPAFYFHDGYLVCRHRYKNKGGERKRAAVYIHRLVAVAEHGIEAVEGNVVHHKNNHRCDNRRENLEIMSYSEHATHHHEREDILENYGSK